MLRKACLSSYKMVAIRNIAADFMQEPPEQQEIQDRPVAEPIYGPVIYSLVLDHLHSQLENLGTGFKIQPYWSGKTLRRRVEEHEDSLVAKKAALEEMIAAAEQTMDDTFFREVIVDDFALFKTSSGIAAGRYCENGIFQSYHEGRECLLFTNPKVICRLEIIDFFSEMLPAAVAKNNRWSVGFPAFYDDVLVMTPDLNRQSISAVYMKPYEIRGLVPIRRPRPFLKGPYR